MVSTRLLCIPLLVLMLICTLAHWISRWQMIIFFFPTSKSLSPFVHIGFCRHIKHIGFLGVYFYRSHLYVFSSIKDNRDIYVPILGKKQLPLWGYFYFAFNISNQKRPRVQAAFQVWHSKAPVEISITVFTLPVFHPKGLSPKFPTSTSPEIISKGQFILKITYHEF